MLLIGRGSARGGGKKIRENRFGKRNAYRTTRKGEWTSLRNSVGAGAAAD